MNAASPLLALSNFGVAFGERVVLADVDLALAHTGVMVLMGPVGTGKSTLLRTLAGITQAVPSFRSWGEARFNGAPLGEAPAPALVAQNARLLMSTVLENILSDLPERSHLTPLAKRETASRLLVNAGLEALLSELDRPVVDLPLAVQRHLAIARTAVADPRLLCVDEPTAGLDADEAAPLLRLLRAEGARRAVLVVSHNQDDARALGGRTALLAGGTIRACAPVQEFFAEPANPVAADFVRTGSCSVPSPGAAPEDVAEEMVPLIPVLPEAATRYVRESLGPRGFLWLKKGLLAGTPRPGIVQDLDYDLEALQRVGVTTLVSLTTKPVDAERLAHYGIRGLWLPIPDMHPPGLDEAEQMCRTVAGLMAAGEVVAYHCRAGLGRTGTMLASHLILEGQSAVQALEAVRRVEPRWVQSDAQVKFLERFSESVSSRQKNAGQLAGVM